MSSSPTFGALSSSSDFHLGNIGMGLIADTIGGIGSGSSGGNGPKYNMQKSVSFKNSKNMTSMSSTVSTYTLVAIIEGKGADRGQIGLASMDLRAPELNLMQFVDTSSYTLLKIQLCILRPVEAIVPDVSSERGSSTGKLFLDTIQDCCPKAQVTTVQRRFFNDLQGIDLVRSLAVEECSNVDSSVTSKYFCMAAAAALIRYVEYIQNISFAKHTLKVTYEAMEDSCLIDISSWKNLDLFDPDQTTLMSRKRPNKTLFDILNSCVTAGGMRTLRSCLLQPSADPKVINDRLDVVQELVNNQSTLDKMRNVMSSLHDLNQLFSLCIQANMAAEYETNKEESRRVVRNKIAQALDLRNLVNAIFRLSTVLRGLKSPFFIKNMARLTDKRLTDIAQLVNERLPPSDSAKRPNAAKDSVLFAIAEGLHSKLDLTRKAYQETLQNLTQIADTLRKDQEDKGLAGITLNYSFSRGYHLMLHARDPWSMHLDPTKFIQVVRNKASLTFTTRDLIKYGDRLLQSEHDILQISNAFLNDLMLSIRAYLPALYNAVELISLLDFFGSLACYSSRVYTARPIFGDQLIIKKGRHPILDCRDEVVPNDTYAAPDSRFVIIAGPNMAGKSTYMRQICQLQILAQLGSMVPAESACFVPMQRIFSRVGHNDDLTRNLSGFAVEMSEMAVILQNSNLHSLIIIDELARSTSTEEGIGICVALCEKLIASEAYVFFATHFLDMAELERMYPVVKNVHFGSSSKVDANGVEVFTPSHVLYNGPYKGPLYGLELAELTTFPPEIIENSRKIAERLRQQKEQRLNFSTSSTNNLDESRKDEEKYK